MQQLARRASLGRSAFLGARFLSTDTSWSPILSHLGTVKVEMNEKGVALVKLNRPAAMNALSAQLCHEMHELATTLNKVEFCEENGVRAVVVTGEGKAFSAGRDLKESKTHSEEEAAKYQRDAIMAVFEFSKVPVPTLVAVNGAAFGWGMELACAADFRMAANEATMCFPETALGIFPGAAGSVLLPRLIGMQRAKDLIYTARRFQGEESVAMGLCMESHPKVDLLEKALALANTVADNAPLGVRGAKQVINGTEWCDTLEEAVDYSNKYRIPLNHTDDFQNALKAFELKQPKPAFHGK